MYAKGIRKILTISDVDKTFEDCRVIAESVNYSAFIFNATVYMFVKVEEKNSCALYKWVPSPFCIDDFS